MNKQKEELKTYISGILLEYDKTCYDDRQKLDQYYFTNKIIKLVEQYYVLKSKRNEEEKWKEIKI